MLEDAVEYLKALKLQVEVIALSVIAVLQALPAINLFLFLSIRCCPWVVEQRAMPHICHRLEFQVYQFPNFLYRHPWGQVQEWECLACLIRWVFQWHHFPQLCISILLYQQQQQQLDWIQWLHMKISPPLKCKCHSFPDGHYLQMQPHQVHRQHLQLGSLPHTIVLTKESLVLECTEGTPSDYHLPVLLFLNAFGIHYDHTFRSLTNYFLQLSFAEVDCYTILCYINQFSESWQSCRNASHTLQ